MNDRDVVLKILLIYREMIPSIRLCGHTQLEELANQGKVEYRSVQEMKLRYSDLKWADIIMLGRLDSWYEHSLVRILKKNGKYLIYIIDDDLLNIPDEVSSSAYYKQCKVQEYIADMLDMSDAIVSPSPVLLEKYAKDKEAILIEEPAIGAVSFKPHTEREVVKIGFAGSIDRKKDVEDILGSVLKEIKKTYGSKVQIELYGAVPSFAEQVDARSIPYSKSYFDYRKTLNDLEWDIGLAPMPDSPFHACKHYNKYIEYAASGIVGIYSRVYPYTRLKGYVDDDTYFLANTPKEWYSTLAYLIEHSETREHARRSVLKEAQTVFNNEVISKKFFSQICDLKIHRSQKNFRSVLFMLKIGNICSRGTHYIEKLVIEFKRFRQNEVL